MPAAIGTLRPYLSLIGPQISWPTLKPTRNPLIVSSILPASALSAWPIVGIAGR